MKSKLPSALLCLVASVSSAHAAFVNPVPQSEMDFLSAVRQVESGNRYDCPPGRAGELGAYQFKREVWSKYTRAPFARAQTPDADEVAARHYSWIAHQLQARGVAVTSWTMALAWNGGINAVTRRHIAGRTLDYAQRVTNLVQDEVNQRLLLTPTFRIALASSN
jgi:hypothetical protein